MGPFSVTIDVGDRQGQRWVPLEVLVDTGATYTWVPAATLHGLGVEPEGRWEFEIAGGEAIERDVAQTWVRYNGSAHMTFVVFGDEGSQPLLGAYSLEGFRLAAEPVRRTLVPTRGFAL